MGIEHKRKKREPNDFRIASSAIAHGMVVVSNDGIFDDIPGVRCDNWIDDPPT
jgi:predicted nucleic acid-binding protein